MPGPNEFWLCYHRLLKAYEEEGQTSEARSEQIIEQLDRMPTPVRHHIVDGMEAFLSVLAELLVEARSSAQGTSQAKHQKWR
jgi:hypothetical protein